MPKIPTSSFSKALPLPREFYDRDPREVGRELLGKLLIRKAARGKLLVGRIVEVEAYLGAKDPASHSFKGPTARNEIMFGPPGFAYVYFIYGNHYCLNVSCQPPGIAGAVLFRAVQPLEGMEDMAIARHINMPSARDLRLLTSGPGRMAEAFGVTRQRDNGKDFTSEKSDLIIAEPPESDYRLPRILATKRIGITKAAEKRLRYVLAGNEFVSGPRHMSQ
jgi:DNA-3-methyladenine glycosylase